MNVFACAESLASLAVYACGFRKYSTSVSLVQYVFFPRSVGPSCVPAPSTPWQAEQALLRKSSAPRPPFASPQAAAASRRSTIGALEDRRIAHVLPASIPKD